MKTIVAAGLVAIFAFPVMCAARKGRSYQGCRELAISRGLVMPSKDANSRHERRQAAGLTTHPTGFVARCMAGIQD